MSERVGPEVEGDEELAAYAQRLWTSRSYQDWRSHMRQDVADILAAPAPATSEGHSVQA